jgi:uncharacterized protein (TIGR02996 family)
VEAALIVAIVAAPATVEPWLAYRDWLLARGDRRGEWIRLALEGGDEASRRQLISEKSLLTPRLYEQSHLLRFGWWRGFIETAALIGAMDDPPTFETIEALFADPHAALISTLGLGHPIMATVPLWQAVLAIERPTITRLRASDLGAGLLELEAKLPRLKSLVLEGTNLRGRMHGHAESRVVSAERIAHDGLHALTCGARSCPALISGNFELPNLASLTWELTDHAEIFDKELEPRGYELFTSPSSILRHPPARLLDLDLLKGVVWARESRSITAGCEIELLESCAILLQLQRLKLSLLAGAVVTRNVSTRLRQ